MRGGGEGRTRVRNNAIGVEEEETHGSAAAHELGLGAESRDLFLQFGEKVEGVERF